jgi:ribosomal protein L13
LPKCDQHPTFKSTRTTYFGSLADGRKIGSGEFSNKLKSNQKASGHIKNEERPERIANQKNEVIANKGITGIIPKALRGREMILVRGRG